MSTLTKKEKLIRDKIAIWGKHQETDKFNYNTAAVNLIGLLACFLTLVAIALQADPTYLSEESVRWSLKAILVATVVVFLICRYRMRKANAHFVRREEMIDEWYEKLGVNKTELNKEFLKGYRNPCWLF